MTVVSKPVDSSARVFGRSAVFVSGVDFNNNDILDLESSFGGAPAQVTVATGAGASCTFRINSLNRRYPPLAAALRLGFYAPDLQEEEEWTSADAPSYTLAADSELDLDLPIANIEFTAITNTITVTARG